ncbi:MAG: hypothetical protein WCI91_00175 [Candidatus Nomurabacteria bacterium]
MHRKYNKFLIVSLVAVVILGVYSYFYNDLKSEAAAGDNALTSSLNPTGSPVATSTSGTSTFSEDSAFLLKLNSLKKIKIDVSIFDSQAFKLLVSNTIKLDPVPYGRINPFSPTDKPVVTNKVTYTLKTNPVSALTAKSAVLNGSLEGAVSNNIYFEYGLVEPLDKMTPKVTPSSIGSFASNIISLTPKTTYLYRAVANINGALVYGDIISFNTN